MDGKHVRFLKALQVYEVAPVFLGAGVGTGTTSIKSGGLANDENSGTINEAEDQTGDSESSGVSPDVVLLQLELIEDGD